MAVYVRVKKGGEGLSVVESEAYIACGGKTDVTLQLRQPNRRQGLFKPTQPVSVIDVAVDQPTESFTGD